MFWKWRREGVEEDNWVLVQSHEYQMANEYDCSGVSIPPLQAVLHTPLVLYIGA